MSTKMRLPIVVGVDGTDRSMRALQFAVQDAQRLGCGLRLVHATPETVPMAPMLPLISVETLDQVSHRILNEAAQMACDLAAGEIQVEKVVRSGSRVHILDEAGEDARLIVLGHRDRSLLGRVFTSSTTTGVAARSHCPVVCVPTTWEPDSHHGRVVVGVDDPAQSRDALGVAFAAAAERKAGLTVLHAWKLESPYDDIIFSRVDIEEWKESVTETVTESLRDWREAYPEVEVEIDVRFHYPAPALVGATEGADLLVIGRHGRRVPVGIHLGSVARTLIREARCPVEIAPPGSAQELPPTDRLMKADRVSPQS